MCTCSLKQPQWKANGRTSCQREQGGAVRFIKRAQWYILRKTKTTETIVSCTTFILNSNLNPSCNMEVSHIAFPLMSTLDCGSESLPLGYLFRLPQKSTKQVFFYFQHMQLNYLDTRKAQRLQY